jgi:hypothetical protein
MTEDRSMSETWICVASWFGVTTISERCRIREEGWSMAELRACPHCGGAATTSELAGIKPIVPGWGWVGCQSCRRFIEYINGERGKKKATAVWNTRASDAEIEGLRKQVSDLTIALGRAEGRLMDNDQ